MSNQKLLNFIENTLNFCYKVNSKQEIVSYLKQKYTEFSSIEFVDCDPANQLFTNKENHRQRNKYENLINKNIKNNFISKDEFDSMNETQKQYYLLSRIYKTDKNVRFSPSKDKIMKKYNVGHYRLNRLKNHFNNFGYSNLPVHGNKKEKSQNRMDINNKLVEFVNRKSPEPWPVEMMKSNQNRTLSSDNSIRELYRELNNELMIRNENTCCWETFRSKFNSLCSDVKIVKPLSDVCNKCKNFYIRKRTGDVDSDCHIDCLNHISEIDL